MLRLESVAIALLGAVLGIVLGLAFALALQRSLADDGIDVLAVPGGQLALFVAIAALVGVLAALWPGRRAHLDVLRAIGTDWRGSTRAVARPTPSHPLPAGVVVIRRLHDNRARALWPGLPTVAGPPRAAAWPREDGRAVGRVQLNMRVARRSASAYWAPAEESTCPIESSEVRTCCWCRATGRRHLELGRRRSGPRFLEAGEPVHHDGHLPLDVRRQARDVARRCCDALGVDRELC
jgi:hypothetical protein